MRSLFSALLFLLFSISLNIAQSNFHNIYSELGNNSEGWGIKKLENGNYLAIALIDTILTEVIIGSDGNIINSSSVLESKLHLSDIDFTSDGGYILIKSERSSEGLDYYLTRISANKEILFNKYIFTRTQDYAKTSVIWTSNNNILLSYIQLESLDSLNLIYLDSLGEILWEKDLTNIPSRRAGYKVIELTDGSFLASTRNTIVKINTQGDSLWSYDAGYFIHSFNQNKTTQDIIIGVTSSVQKINPGGMFISKYTNNLLREINSISIFNDNTIIVYTPTTYLLFSAALELQNQLSTLVKIVDSFTDDAQIISVGTFFSSNPQKSNLSLLSWNKNDIPVKNLFLLSPNGGEFLPYEDRYIRNNAKMLDISWYCEGVNSTKIEFSSDNGSSWKLTAIIDSTNLVSDYSAEIPFLNSDYCLIRISDFEDPSLFDISTGSFSVRAYKYEDYIAGNECKMWIGNDGMSAHNPVTDDSGFFWPGGEDATIPAIFEDGIIWGGIHDGMIKVNGATYRYGLTPGAILENGMADDPKKREYSIFKLKKDWESLPEGHERDKFKYYYDNWPGQHGAPYIDMNNDGIFTKDVDIPEILGEETLFYVANDLDSSRTAFTYGSPPIGLEFQQTLFAFNTPDLKDAVFKKVIIINKSNSPVDSMYIGYWSDNDLGYGRDDFSGCDTTLNMMFTYNGDNNDEDNYGPNPPAIGRILLQGPIVEGVSGDRAYYNGKEFIGFRNIPMTSFCFYIGAAGFIYEDPQLGTYTGSEEFYRYLTGLLWNSDPFIDPTNGDTVKSILAGDPVTDTGWYEGDGWPGGPPPGDRRALMSSGPFTMAPGDTQEVVYAIFMARGSDNIQSITELRKTAQNLRDFWKSTITVDVEETESVLPTNYSLSQNYPNPFNPTTTIKYSIPSQPNDVVNAHFAFTTNVTMTIYDILGRKVKTLVNQKQKPGNYEVIFDAGNYPSGVYFYQLRAGNYVKVKKLILLK